MSEWEAKYNAVVVGIKDPQIVESAERIVAAAARVSAASGLPLHGVVAEIASVASQLQAAPSPKIINTRMRELFMPNTTKVKTREEPSKKERKCSRQTCENACETGQIWCEPCLKADREWMDRQGNHR